jgi:hypothetical protein
MYHRAVGQKHPRAYTDQERVEHDRMYREQLYRDRMFQERLREQYNVPRSNMGVPYWPDDPIHTYVNAVANEQRWSSQEIEAADALELLSISEKGRLDTSEKALIDSVLEAVRSRSIRAATPAERLRVSRRSVPRPSIPPPSVPRSMKCTHCNTPHEVNDPYSRKDGTKFKCTDVNKNCPSHSGRVPVMRKLLNVGFGGSSHAYTTSIESVREMNENRQMKGIYAGDDGFNKWKGQRR